MCVIVTTMLVISFSGRLPQLDKCHAHTIAAIVKKLFFMKPAIPKNSRASFIQAAKDINDNSDPQALNRAISELPPVRQLTKKSHHSGWCLMILKMIRLSHFGNEMNGKHISRSRIFWRKFFNDLVR